MQTLCLSALLATQPPIQPAVGKLGRSSLRTLHMHERDRSQRRFFRRVCSSHYRTPIGRSIESPEAPRGEEWEGASFIPFPRAPPSLSNDQHQHHRRAEFFSFLSSYLGGVLLSFFPFWCFGFFKSEAPAAAEPASPLNKIAAAAALTKPARWLSTKILDSAQVNSRRSMNGSHHDNHHECAAFFSLFFLPFQSLFLSFFHCVTIVPSSERSRR